MRFIYLYLYFRFSKNTFTTLLFTNTNNIEYISVLVQTFCVRSLEIFLHLKTDVKINNCYHVFNFYQILHGHYYIQLPF